MPEVLLTSLGSAAEDDGGPAGAIHHFPCTIGRHPECGFHIADPLVSRQHCILTLRQGLVWVEDLGSRNGTRINGEPLEQGCPLHDGDRLDVAHRSFRVRLAGVPAYAADDEDAVPVAAEQAGGRGVLVVEDDVSTATTLALLLQSWGHRVRVARDGPEAIQAARAEPPDVVFLDIGLPSMSGVEVARRIRAEPGLKQARLVAVTGDEGATEVLLSRAQFEQLLIKPVSSRVLREALAPAG
jgi:CheY-like chemotaxis protein